MGPQKTIKNCGEKIFKRKIGVAVPLSIVGLKGNSHTLDHNYSVNKTVKLKKIKLNFLFIINFEIIKNSQAPDRKRNPNVPDLPRMAILVKTLS